MIMMMNIMMMKHSSTTNKKNILKINDNEEFDEDEDQIKNSGFIKPEYEGSEFEEESDKHDVVLLNKKVKFQPNDHAETPVDDVVDDLYDYDVNAESDDEYYNAAAANNNNNNNNSKNLTTTTTKILTKLITTTKKITTTITSTTTTTETKTNATTTSLIVSSTTVEIKSFNRLDEVGGKNESKIKINKTNIDLENYELNEEGLEAEEGEEDEEDLNIDDNYEIDLSAITENNTIYETTSKQTTTAITTTTTTTTTTSELPAIILKEDNLDLNKIIENSENDIDMDSNKNDYTIYDDDESLDEDHNDIDDIDDDDDDDDDDGDENEEDDINNSLNFHNELNNNKRNVSTIRPFINNEISDTHDGSEFNHLNNKPKISKFSIYDLVKSPALLAGICFY